jgi:hypothetical protein
MMKIPESSVFEVVKGSIDGRVPDICRYRNVFKAEK